MEKPWLIFLFVPHCLWEGISSCLYISSLLPSIELVLEMLLWLDNMIGLGLLSHARRSDRARAQGPRPWGINLTKVLDPGAMRVEVLDKAISGVMLATF